MASKHVSSCLKKLCYSKSDSKPAEIQQMFSSLLRMECGNSFYHSPVSMHSHYRIWYGRMIFIEIKSAVTIELEILELKSIDFSTAQMFMQTCHLQWSHYNNRIHKANKNKYPTAEMYVFYISFCNATTRQL